MKTSLAVITILVLWVTGLLLITIPAVAQSVPVEINEPYAGQVVCAPGVYLVEAPDCLPLGPSKILTELAQQGIIYPPLPIPAAQPDPLLNEIDIQYALINLPDNEPAPIFATLDDAIIGERPVRHIPAGFGLRYVTYTHRTTINSGNYVQLTSGGWMRASPANISSTFQGLQFRRTPTIDIGWIIKDTLPRSQPSYQSPELNKTLRRESVVQIYDVVEAKETTWYMVGLNEWVDRHSLRQLVVNTTPPEGLDNNRWIELNLYDQTLSVYDQGELVFATIMASGVEPYYTRPGLFKIYEKKAVEKMTGAFEADRSDYYHLDGVPWTLYYDKARAIHGAYWRAWFGVPQSHGCVNLSIGDARWVYDWAEEGDWVYVWDPSGETPTDSSLYTDGGA